jgi:NADH-quinone oxidoreductase subunit E
MTGRVLKLLHQLIRAEGVDEINRWIAKYPSTQKQSAVMAALMVVQEEHGHLTETLMDAVATYLEMPPVAVYEVASFYSMYEKAPVGRHCINVCTNISCQLRDSHLLVKKLEDHLGIALGETTPDERFTLRAVECLGACVNAPMMQVDKDYHEHLADIDLDTILEKYR